MPGLFPTSDLAVGFDAASHRAHGSRVRAKRSTAELSGVHLGSGHRGLRANLRLEEVLLIDPLSCNSATFGPFHIMLEDPGITKHGKV